MYKKSKCLRAFDRRPPPRRDTCPNVQNAHQEKEKGSTSYDHLNTPQMMERSGVASSPESSCSEDHGQCSHSGQMDVEHEPLLDWEQVDWFLESSEP